MEELSANPSSLALSPGNLAPHPHQQLLSRRDDMKEEILHRVSASVTLCVCAAGLGGQGGDQQETTQRRRPWLRVNQKSPLPGQAGGGR